MVGNKVFETGLVGLADFYAQQVILRDLEKWIRVHGVLIQ
jgi:hypothetical protein